MIQLDEHLTGCLIAQATLGVTDTSNRAQVDEPDTRIVGAKRAPHRFRRYWPVAANQPLPVTRLLTHGLPRLRQPAWIVRWSEDGEAHRHVVMTMSIPPAPSPSSWGVTPDGSAAPAPPPPPP